MCCSLKNYFISGEFNFMQMRKTNNGELDYLYLTVLGGAMSDNPSYAGICKECGKCIELCPQKIDIHNI